ncbi:MAG TPA: Flp pilus assembly protein CpaB [Chlorobaculum sp.]|nr:Flp pilus assembly protein CpaB [Chlorobaculum sp.]
MKLPVFAAVALTLGAIAAFIAARWVGGEQTPGAKVVVVALPIDAGKTITADQIKVIDWPVKSVPQDAPSSPNNVVGRIAKVSMIPGEPVLPGKLAPKNATGGLSSIIPSGKRAITVYVNEVIAVAGFALPGSYVDVLVCGKDANQQPFSRTVLSHIKVLAVAQETTADHEKPKLVNAVTLELTPHDAEKLDLARNIGLLSLVLRNELDTSEITSTGARLSDIVNSQPTPATTASPARQTTAPRQSSGPEEIRSIIH